ncbi:hypothetical protein LR48_Vigan04g073800 [Vigna angularis]|uniref:Uncharacterized protein n=1 Tax=Phaseolus angularis TaxID=3914 RepID=A0A0L9UCA4_PHAAN|nr:hypothetical protein LR48_Vigan04g073800 [Vigna angularis]
MSTIMLSSSEESEGRRGQGYTDSDPPSSDQPSEKWSRMTHRLICSSRSVDPSYFSNNGGVDPSGIAASMTAVVKGSRPSAYIVYTVRAPLLAPYTCLLDRPGQFINLFVHIQRSSNDWHKMLSGLLLMHNCILNP